MADSSHSLVDTLEKLKELLEEAQREVQGLLKVTEEQVGGSDKKKLELGLKKVDKKLGVLDIHIGDIRTGGNDGHDGHGGHKRGGRK
jgi:hypothetical protein